MPPDPVQEAVDGYKSILLETQLELARMESALERASWLLQVERNKRRRLKKSHQDLQAAYTEKLRLYNNVTEDFGIAQSEIRMLEQEVKDLEQELSDAGTRSSATI